MKPPIGKTGSHVRDIIVSSNRLFCKNLDNKRKLFEEYNCKTLLDFDLKAETDWILTKIKSFDSPIVFSHNDFRFGNTMITEDDGIIIGDYDVTAYFNRGFDFATYFTDFFKLDGKELGFKDVSIVRSFVGKYMIERALINLRFFENDINSMEHILKEIKVFALVYSVFIINTLLVFNPFFNVTQEIKIVLSLLANCQCRSGKVLDRQKVAW